MMYGIVIFRCNDNTITNTLTYDVEFEDSDNRQMANMIGENVSTRTDSDSHVIMSLKTTLNHKKTRQRVNLKTKIPFSMVKENSENRHRGGTLKHCDKIELHISFY